jgi:hypothetical protein
MQNSNIPRARNALIVVGVTIIFLVVPILSNNWVRVDLSRPYE